MKTKSNKEANQYIEELIKKLEFLVETAYLERRLEELKSQLNNIKKGE